MDGDFLDQNVNAITAEVDEYSREIFKTQKIFALRVKKMQVQAGRSWHVKYMA